ncbi:MAG TPA: MotA/TolQ/ExbB proton channel family protein [Myxococcota bacterium]|nr:MotA/TolQ/ExbB proton channel family protein [Myxococcota bacterium]HRY95028.1 MotA/TolQ/ExbB proton channel family protein [Myxococcota bacterium]
MTKRIPFWTQAALMALLLAPAGAWAAEPAAANGEGLMSTIAYFFEAGGIFIYINCAMLCWGLAIIIERMFFIFFRYNVNAEAFMAQVQKLVMANNIERAIKLCNAAPSAALPRVVKAGLTRANRGEVEIQNAVEEATLEIVPILQKRTPNLAQIANLATLFGLLGTITGLIRAFASLGAVSPELKAAILSKGISEAMYNTAMGLGIAIICMLGHLFLTNMTKKIVDEIDQYSVKLENLLISRGKGLPVRSDGTPE